jgi:hypothetical protein
MRKATWAVLGIAGLSLLLCSAGEVVLAQTDTGAAAGAAGAGQATGTAGADTAALRQTVLQLQGDLAQVRQELAQVRAELADLSASMGVGGAGQAGGAPQDTTPGRVDTTGPLRAGTAQETLPRGTTVPGEAVVDAIFTGTVRSVSDTRLVLTDEGEQMTLTLGEQTRVFRDGQRIAARELEAGTRVRVTVDLTYRRDLVTEIVALPSAR